MNALNRDERFFSKLGKDSITDSNIFISYLASRRSFHRNYLYYLIVDFGHQLNERVQFGPPEVNEELPSKRLIILVDGKLGAYASKRYGMTAFTVHLDGKIDERLSKIWRYYMCEYLGKVYAEAFERYTKKSKREDEYKEELNFLLNHFNKYEQRKNYLNQI